MEARASFQPAPAQLEGPEPAPFDNIFDSNPAGLTLNPAGWAGSILASFLCLFVTSFPDGEKSGTY